MLRIIEHSRVIHSLEVGNSPVVLHIYIIGDEQHVLFGTINGRIGILNIERLFLNNIERIKRIYLCIYFS